MGCGHSSSAVGAEDTSASRTLESLPDNEKKALTTTWKQMRKDPRRHSTLIFVRLFRKHTIYRRYFQDEPGVPMTALASDERVQKHCVAFNEALGELVRALTSPKGPDLPTLLARLAKAHKDMPLTRIDFDNLSVVFLDHIKGEASVQVSDEDLKVWDHVMNLVSTDICERMDFIKRDTSVQSISSVRRRVTAERRLLGMASCLKGSDDDSDDDDRGFAMRVRNNPIVLPLPAQSTTQLEDFQTDVPGRNIDDYDVPMPKGFSNKKLHSKSNKLVTFDRHMQLYPPPEFKDGTNAKLSSRDRRRRWNAMCSSVYDRGELPPRVYEEVSRFDDTRRASLRRSGRVSSITSLLNVDPSASLTLSPKDKKHVTDMWTLMRRDARASGVKVFITLFEMYPESLEKFAKLRGRSIEELKMDKKMQSHAEMVMKSLSAIIDNLNDPALVIEMLRSLGKSHNEIMIYKDDFLKIKMALIAVAKEMLGAEWNRTYETAWRRAIDAIYAVLFQYIKGPEPTIKEPPWTS